MISKNQIKYVRSLETKKGRKKEGAFVAEGPKVVGDLQELLKPLRIFATQSWIEATGCSDAVAVTDDELRKISFLQHPQDVVAVFQMFEHSADTIEKGTLSLALDGVQDPGNLGTIIRIADWFGIERIFCSHDTADVYNPKVVQATMGSIARVKVVYTDLCSLLSSLPSHFPVFGTFLDGDNIYARELPNEGIVVMGNEGKGISASVSGHVNNRLLIPNYPLGRKTAESLNVAVATAIVCSEFRRGR